MRRNTDTEERSHLSKKPANSNNKHRQRKPTTQEVLKAIDGVDAHLECLHFAMAELASRVLREECAGCTPETSEEGREITLRIHRLLKKYACCLKMRDTRKEVTLAYRDDGKEHGFLLRTPEVTEILVAELPALMARPPRE